jgi:hypothetical protein
MLKISIINFWKDADNDMFFVNFMRENIDENVKIVPYNQNPDILLSSVCGNIFHISKIKANVKIMFLGENLSRGPYTKWKKVLNMFDFVVGFHPTNLVQKKIRFPLWLIYYHFYKWDDHSNILRYIQAENDKNRQMNKTILSTCIARHDRGGQRTFICNLIEKYKPGQVKYPSSFRKNTNSIDSGKKNKINFLKQCIFNVCPENSTGELYHTEKIMHAFEGGTIPIYWGVDKPEKDLICQNKYIYCNLNDKDNVKIKQSIDSYKNFYDGPIFTQDAKYIIDHYYETLQFQIQIKLKRLSQPKVIALSTSILSNNNTIFDNVKLLSKSKSEMEKIKEEYRLLNKNDILVIVFHNVPKNIQNLIFDIQNHWKGMIVNENVKIFRKCKYVDFYFNL